MTQNLRLVNYFISKFYRNRTLELEHIAAYDFEFILHSDEPINFESYAQRTNLLARCCKLQLSDPVSDDDILFVSKFEMEVPRAGNDSLFATGTNNFTVANGLLTKVTVDYHQTQAEFAQIKAALLENDKILTASVDEDDNDLKFV
ncbi:MAG: hypothetical protein HRU29_13305 [Rhizobiales bacterium]|nr:hypothetical protein [Hyphomicrobiales bacterium]NRB15370.1 hypothetical protein [Hyphomicrobiales bacterium]